MAVSSVRSGCVRVAPPAGLAWGALLPPAESGLNSKASAVSSSVPCGRDSLRMCRNSTKRST